MSASGLVVPVYNERSRVGEYVPGLLEWATRRHAALLFVDDGSTDGTAAALASMLAGTSATLLTLEHGGKGAAVAAGIAALEADVDVIGFCDLDLSTPLPDIDVLLGLAERAPVLAIGSRDVTGSILATPEGKVRETLGRAYNRLLQILVTPGVVDTQCGAKAARAEVWRRVLGRCTEPGFAWDAEVVATAIALGIHVREVPVRWTHDTRTRVRVVRDGIDMLAAALRISRRLHRAAGSHASSASPTAAAVGHAHELVAAGPRHWWFRSRAALVATALRRCNPPADTFLVDVGAGPGWLAALLGWSPERLIAAEPDRDMAAEVAGSGNLSVRAVGEALPLAPRSCGVVTLLDVLEHTTAPGALLKEARRVLRDDGLVVILVPAHRWLWSSTDEHVGHLRRYRRRDLHRDIRSADLDVVLDAGVFAWAVPAMLIIRKLLHRIDTGLAPASLLVDRAALVLTSVERHLLGRLRQPLGASLLLVARPTEGSTGAHR